MFAECFAVLLLALLIPQPVNTKRLSPCSCQFGDDFYNLRPLANRDGDWPALEVTYHGYEFGYNPCIPFTIGAGCKNVAICKWVDNIGVYEPLALQTNVSCRKAVDNKGITIIELIYHQPDPQSKEWNTIVQLKCNKNLKNAKLTVIKDDAIPVLQVEGKCGCANTCYDFIPLPPSAFQVEDAVIGGSVGGVLLVALAVGCVIYYRRRKRMQERNRLNGGARRRGYRAIQDPEVVAVELNDGDERDDDDVRDGDDDASDGNDDASDGEDDAGDDDARGDDDDVRDDDDDARDGDDDARGGDDDVRHGDDDARDGDNEVRDGRNGVDIRRDGGDIDGGGANGSGGDDRGRDGSPQIADYFPHVPDDRLIEAVEEQHPHSDDENRRSPSIPIQVAGDPERQGCSDDESSSRPRSAPVEHSCELLSPRRDDD